MNPIKHLTSNSLALFMLFIALLFIVMLIISSVLANRWPPESAAWFFTSG